MRNNFKFFKLPVFALCLLTLGACNKYEEGPGISLVSGEKRVEGTWAITKATEFTSSGEEDVTSDYDDESFSFNEDGTATHSFHNGSTQVNANGSWELLNDNETLKLTVTWTFLGMNFENVDEWAIQKLTVKEIIIEKTEDDVRTRLEMN